jgi:membrane associated rhomboid family serine protease
MRQQASTGRTIASAREYCSGNHTHGFRVAIEKVTGSKSPDACAMTMAALHTSADPAALIRTFAAEAAPYRTLAKTAGRRYTVKQFADHYRAFSRQVPPDLTARLLHDPRTHDAGHMLTATFAHAGWGHLLGNLFFFVAFAATVEVIVGYLLFPVILVALALGTGIAYSLWSAAVGNMLPTLGLSGVVMGMIGLFIWFLPTARSRCLLWLVIGGRTLAVPAWLLAGWYIGWNVFDLAHAGGHQTGTNFVAHVSGAAPGFLFGPLFFRSLRERVRAEFYGEQACRRHQQPVYARRR